MFSLFQSAGVTPECESDRRPRPGGGPAQQSWARAEAPSCQVERAFPLGRGRSAEHGLPFGPDSTARLGASV